jgi:hypothetical protein
VKFQPDILIRGHQEEILAAIDFESPNSSDARVPHKDVTAYLRWVTTSAQSFEYLIITSLPDRPTSTWELRYASTGKWNEHHVRAKIQRNRFATGIGTTRKPSILAGAIILSRSRTLMAYRLRWSMWTQ